MMSKVEIIRKCLYFNVCHKIENYNGRKWQENWYHYNNGFLCLNHYMKLIRNPKYTSGYRKKYNDKWNPINNKKWNKINTPKLILFKDKQIILKENPRTGYCSNCSNNIHDGSCKRTDIHHIKYHDDDPLKDTIELCHSCHMKETIKLKQLGRHPKTGQFIKKILYV